MTSEYPFERVEERGWRLGFSNLFSRENRKWWRSRRWLVQMLVWLVLLPGFVVMALYVIPGLSAPDGSPVVDQDPLIGALQGFFGVGSMLLAIGITILMQDEVIGEKNTGTAEWVLSKPVSRSAFLLSKLAAHTLGMLAAMVAVPALAAYLLISIYQGSSYPAGPFILGSAILALHTFFYLALNLMLGVLTNRRDILLGISLGVLLGGSFLRSFLPQISLATPWFLPDVAGLAAMAVPLAGDMIGPIAATGLWSLLFIAAALLRFQSYEF